jgi:hypothetical protein
MGWGDCGNDSQGRPIGYNFEATCDHPGCNEKIDRGLAYACGGMHGSGEGCEGYFCDSHLRVVDSDRYELTQGQLCEQCCKDYCVDDEPQTIREGPMDYNSHIKRWFLIFSVGCVQFHLLQAKNKKTLRQKMDRWKVDYLARFAENEAGS